MVIFILMIFCISGNKKGQRLSVMAANMEEEHLASEEAMFAEMMVMMEIGRASCRERV